MNICTALDQLEHQGFFVWDDFLSEGETNSTLLDFHKLLSAGFFKDAKIGKTSTAHTNIRTDKTHWLDALALTDTQNVFWEKLEKLKHKINERLFLGLWSLEGHYSVYSQNGLYHQHQDRFQSDDKRTISMVLYLNENWIAEHGGELRIQEYSGTHQNIAPIAGRLVCFISADILHEVLVTHHQRLSFAGWWRRK